MLRQILIVIIAGLSLSPPAYAGDALSARAVIDFKALPFDQRYVVYWRVYEQGGPAHQAYLGQQQEQQAPKENASCK